MRRNGDIVCKELTQNKLLLADLHFHYMKYGYINSTDTIETDRIARLSSLQLNIDQSTLYVISEQSIFSIQMEQ